MTSRRSLRVILLLAVLMLSNGCVSGPPPTNVELGEAALEAGNWRLAKTHFTEALKADPRSGGAWFGQARAQMKGRNPEGALQSLSSLSKADRPLFVSEAGATYRDALEAATRHRLGRDQNEAALVAARTLAKLDPGRRGLARLLGQAIVGEAARRRWQGDRAVALTLYREACQISPEALDAWVGAAEILLELGRGNEAIRLLEAARTAHPTAGQIRMLTVQALGAR
jgi:tetratricopeptide (TPR) repeat protein